MKLPFPTFVSKRHISKNLAFWEKKPWIPSTFKKVVLNFHTSSCVYFSRVAAQIGEHCPWLNFTFRFESRNCSYFLYKLCFHCKKKIIPCIEKFKIINVGIKRLSIWYIFPGVLFFNVTHCKVNVYRCKFVRISLFHVFI